jgi:hypothetical protein
LAVSYDNIKLMVLKAAPKKRETHHQKQRHGKHHAHDKNYHNTYWPYLPLAIIVGLGFLANSLWPTFQSAVLGYATNTSVNGLLLETNKERQSHGLGQLALNSQLSKAAEAKAQDMASRNYWSHVTPDGNQPWAFIKEAGYSYSSAGENLAYGFEGSDSTITGWMGSTPHRINMLNSGYKDVGFGMANVEDYQGTGPQTIVVAMYGAPFSDGHTAAAATSDSAVAGQSTTHASSPTQAPQQISRIELFTSPSAGWVILTVVIIAAFAAAIFLFRHSLFWHRALVKGERFIIRHPILDVTVVGVATIAVVLTRTAGNIF